VELLSNPSVKQLLVIISSFVIGDCNFLTIAVALLLINLSSRASSTIEDKLWLYPLYTIYKNIKDKRYLSFTLSASIAFTINSFYSTKIIGIAI